MIDKEKKANILKRFDKKQEKIFVSNILDKAFRFEKVNKIEYTDFLNLNEVKVIDEILKNLNVFNIVFKVNENAGKSNIFFIPDYIFDSTYVIEEHIKALKVIPKDMTKLLHKDFMGAIYNLGIKNEKIGDIFLTNDCAYFFVMNDIEEYILNNLFKVKNQEVKVEKIDLFGEEVKNISLNLVRMEYVCASFRVDSILSSVYNLSREETKTKIISGDLFINDKNIIVPDTKLNDDDIVSFKHFGKFKFSKKLYDTKSGKIRIEIFKYA